MKKKDKEPKKVLRKNMEESMKKKGKKDCMK